MMQKQQLLQIQK